MSNGKKDELIDVDQFYCELIQVKDKVNSIVKKLETAFPHLTEPIPELHYTVIDEAWINLENSGIDV